MSRRRRGSSPFSLFAFQDIITSVTGIMVLVTLFLALDLVQRKEGSPPQKTEDITEDLQSAMVQNQADISRLERLQRELTKLLEELASYDAATVSRELARLQQSNQKLREESEARERERDAAARRRKQAEEAEAESPQEQEKLDEILKMIAEKEGQLEKLKQSKRVIFNASQGAGKTPWLIEVTEDRLTVAQVGAVAAPQKFTDNERFLNWAKQRNRNQEYFVLLVKPDGIKRYLVLYAALRQGLKFDIGFDLLTQELSAIDPELGAAAP